MSWYREHLETSLELIRRTGLAADAELIDIGGGASTLVDDLLRLGFLSVSVLDLSAVALEKARQRLGTLSERVRWIASDVTNASLAAEHYDLWHDRAVFHFLTDPVEKAAYVATATRVVKNGRFLILATFALDGPAKCSGLQVERYGPEELAGQFPEFELLESRREVHRTPTAAVQNFTYVLLQKHGKG